MSAVAPELAAAFERSGAVCIRGLLTPAVAAPLREGIDFDLAHPSPRAEVASRAEDLDFSIEDFCNRQGSSAYRRAIFASCCGAAAGALTGSWQVRLYHEHMSTKEPGTRQCIPWHQDQRYYSVDGDCRRRAFSVRFIGDGVHHAPRAWATSPEFPGLAQRLAAGASIDDPLRPLLWERAP